MRELPKAIPPPENIRRFFQADPAPSAPARGTEHRGYQVFSDNVKRYKNARARRFFLCNGVPVFEVFFGAAGVPGAGAPGAPASGARRANV